MTPLLILLAWWATHRATPIYLVDFATYKPPADWQINQAQVGPLVWLFISIWTGRPGPVPACFISGEMDGSLTLIHILNQVLEIMKRKKCFTQESLDFMERILVNSGTGAF